MTTKKKDAPEAPVDSTVPYGPIEKDHTAAKVVLAVTIGFGLFFVVLLLLIFNVIKSFLNFAINVDDHGPDGGHFSVVVDDNEIRVDNGAGSGTTFSEMMKYAVNFNEGSVAAHDKASNLSLYGFIMSAEDANMTIEASGRADDLRLTKGDAGEMKISVSNSSDSALKASECDLVGVEFALEGVSVFGNIKVGSTVNEVKAVFGEPSSITTSENGGVMRYEDASTESNYYEFTVKDGKVSNIKWQLR